MELRQLRHFVAVVDTGNLSRAADRVAISQPALTRSIKNLEDLLGVVLLERKPRGVVPTEAGVTLYHHAKMVLNDCNRLTTEVRAYQRGLSGTVQVGIAAMFSNYVIDTVAREMALQHPGISMVITQGFFEELLREQLDGRLDLIFGNFPPVSVPAELTVETLMTVRSSVVVGQRHLVAKRREVEKSSLVDSRWVLPDQMHAQDFLEQLFSSDGLPTPRALVRTNSLPLMVSLVNSGEFLGVIPEQLIARELTAGAMRRVPISGASVERRAGLIYRAASHPRPAVQQFQQQVRLVCASLANAKPER
jgi:DNA-binding transcriptional LysR family regulator